MSGFDALCSLVSEKKEMEFMDVYDNLRRPVSEDDMRILLRRAAMYGLVHVVKFIANQPMYDAIWLDESLWRVVLYSGNEVMLKTLSKRASKRRPEWISGVRFDEYVKRHELEDRMVYL